MERNLDRRVEVLCRVLNPDLVRQIRDGVLDIYLSDNDRAYLLGPDGYRRVEPTPDAAPLSAQHALLAHYTRPRSDDEA